MTALATIADLEARLGHTVADATQAQAMLDDVSAAVRSYTGQHFTRTTTYDRLSARNGLVRLPQRPVVNVESVHLHTGALVGFTWHTGSETLCVTNATMSCSRTSWVYVLYEHGYDEIPADVVAVVCNVSLRALGTDPTGGAVASRSITNYQETFGPVGAAGSTGLFSSESKVLDRYRRVGTVAWVGV